MDTVGATVSVRILSGLNLEKCKGFLSSGTKQTARFNEVSGCIKRLSVKRGMTVQGDVKLKWISLAFWEIADLPLP